MESKWRQNVPALIGPTFTHWTFPLGFPQNYTYLCAELNTPVLWFGKVYTHLLKCWSFGVGYGAYFARFRDGSNVLNEIAFWGPAVLPFPYGLEVESDRV